MKYGARPPVVQSFLPELETEDRLAETAPEVPLVDRLRAGLPMEEFTSLQKLLAVPEEELGRLVGISAATLHRRKRSGRLETPESERVVRFARLFGQAMDVLGSELAAREWLKAENPATAGETPLAYADTEFGAREVEHVLGRLDHGVF